MILTDLQRFGQVSETRYTSNAGFNLGDIFMSGRMSQFKALNRTHTEIARWIGL